MNEDTDTSRFTSEWIAPDPQMMRLLDRIDDLQIQLIRWRSIADDLYFSCAHASPKKTTAMISYEEALRESHKTD